MAITGTKHNDDLGGTAANDVFKLQQGGDDIAFGDIGDDRFSMGGALSAADKLDGGVGRDTVVLEGDYSAGIVFAGTTIRNIEVLRLTGAWDFALTLHNGNLAAGAKLAVDASGIPAGHHLTFDGSAELDAQFFFTDGAGDDTLTGGAGRDHFVFENGGSDIAYGRGGDDTFDRRVPGALQLDGGGGHDTLIDHVGGLTGAFANIEKYVLFGSTGSSIALTDASVPGGKTFSFDATGLSNADPEIGRLYLDASAETDGFIKFLGSSGNDTLDGFGPGDRFFGGAGGNDRALFSAFSGSLSLGAANLTGVELISVRPAGGGLSLVVEDATVEAGKTLVVSVSSASTGALSFDGSAETDGTFQIRDSTLFSDTFALSDGADVLVYTSVASSTGASTLDRLTNFNADEDRFLFAPGVFVTSFDGIFNVSSVTAATFDQKMNYNPSGGTFSYNAAWMMHVTSGDAGFSGHDFLVVEVSGDFHYSSGTDFVFDITGYSGTFGVGDFGSI